MMLVKLGGSVITDKMNYRTLREDVLFRLAGELARSEESVILVHGAGSFGHVIAARHQLQNGYNDPSQLMAAAQVMEDVRTLNLAVTSALNRSGLPAVSLPPSALVELREGRLDRLELGVFRRYLDLGMVPVTFGDVALDSRRGLGICSGDQLMESLAREFAPRRIIFCSDVDGVFTDDPVVHPEARMLEAVDRETLSSLPRSQRCADVTGSIFGKIETMLRIAAHGGDSMVINGLAPGRLAAALKGEKVPGTRVVV
ncbi:MAG: isopentenyl phosphate kinase family protein [Methanomassiliicoccus sp.]|nr:isopentenyl phosphate kinase family protein [Methanomassiliicoccus sp.]